METFEIVCACANLRRASRAISRLYEQYLAAVDLSSTQMTILMTLGKGGPRPLSGLAGVLAMDRTSLYRTLKPLEKRGIVRIRATADNRAKEALLTKAGERHLAEAMPYWERAQACFVDAFGKDEWKRIQRALVRVVEVSK